MPRRDRPPVRERLKPQQMFYEGQKLKVRITRLIEASSGSPAPDPVRSSGELAGRALGEHRPPSRPTLSIGIIAGAALLGTAITASSDVVARWVPAVLGVVGGLFVVALLVDLVRRRAD